jgi:hypothetical protein
MIGKKFHRLTVLSKGDVHEYPCGDRSTKWNCVCECGKQVEVIRKNLLNGNTKSCGCLNIEKTKKNSRSLNLIGQKYSRLTVVDKVYINNRKHWKCICECGNSTIVTTGRIRSGTTRSCGCLNLDKIIERNKDPKIVSKRLTHGIKSFKRFHWKTGETIWCKGSYERDVIDWLNKYRINFAWQIPFPLSNKSIYICDLLLTDNNIYVEIKGRWYEDALDKFELFLKEYDLLNIEVWNKEHISVIRSFLTWENQ